MSESSTPNTRADRTERSGESGQAIVWVAVFLPLFLSVIGLTIDGGLVFGARRELQNVADAAARAGAMQIDQRAYRDSSGATVALDPSAARQAAAEYIALQGSGLTGTIDAEPQRIVVEVRQEVPTTFLRLVGVSSVQISASAPASVRHGIDRGSP